MVLSLKDVEKTYMLNSGGTITALTGINLEVGDGEFVAVVGPSGCGKTTLLKLVSGVVQPTQGEITLEGTPQQKLNGQSLGMVFQQPALLPWRTVLRNVLLPCEFHGQKRDQSHALAMDLLELAGLTDFVHRKPWELSLGMQQRVSICRALITDPKILLMDEPFAALDAISRFQFVRFLLEIWSLDQKTVLFVTHNLQEAVFLADRVVVMTPRPGSIASVIDVPLPRPRKEEHLYDQAFSSCARTIHQLLA